ncbi:ERF family protein [Clostridium sardiniense]|uniref:ERF family protein n=1 Tax=Clostridium sardiniense TaxID=29369 RepID=A0ABS7L0F2_CLOSR|nr:ERF family protein [Clostridium sardiniense]MBY0756538.1 ERF family protein [Clostridium sardiniense]MDQ0460287.1 hypothetical protein [Clostridium sardiniense]
MVVEAKKLNIFQKIQKARVELQKRDLKKTGHNKHANYKYFELGDFLPEINDICCELGLYTEFEYKEKEAKLYVIDTDNLDIKREWSTPIEVAQLRGCSAIQNIGGTQSYARRYLYMMAFEIAETDTIDGGEVDEEAAFANQKISKAHIFTINKLIAETNTDINKFLAWSNVSKIEDITNEMFNECIKSLNDKKKKLEQEKSLKQQQEEHQKELEKQKEDFEF